MENGGGFGGRILNLKLLVLWVYGLVLCTLVGGVEYSNFTDFPEFQNLASYGVSSTPLMAGLTLIYGAAAKGAVCLDGTLPGYHIHRGYGSGANVTRLPYSQRIWVRSEQLARSIGGGWCNTIRNCVYRKKTHRGSSIYMEKQIPFVGILSNKANENPDFYNWNRVKVRYCDGASFGGDSQNERAQLYFRGQRIWSAAMEELMSKGMHYAKQALLSGCSAGGLASILHCDEFSDLFPHTTKVKCLSDAGLFLDTLDVSGQRALRKIFGGVVSLQSSQPRRKEINIILGCPKEPAKKLYNAPPSNSVFFPQNLIASVKMPLFLLNTAYDSWQVQESIAPPSADPHGYWHDCKLNNAHCSGSQIHFLQGFRNQMLNAVRPFSRFSKNGLFLNSCFAHCQSERQDTWFSQASPHIGNKGIAQSVGNWYFDRSGIKAIDCPYPCDSSCHNLVFRTG